MAECLNAKACNCGLQRLPVRGPLQVKCVALLSVLAQVDARSGVSAPM